MPLQGHLMIINHGDWEKCLSTGEKQMSLILKNGYRPDSLTSIPGKAIEQLILETISKNIRARKS